MGEVTELIHCPEANVDMGCGQWHGCSDHPPEQAPGDGGRGLHSSLMAPSPSTGRGPVLITRDLIYHAELMVSMPGPVAKGTAGTWRLCAPAPRALTGMRRQSGGAGSRVKKPDIIFKTTAGRGPGWLRGGRVHSCSDLQRLPQSLPAHPRGQNFPRMQASFQLPPTPERCSESSPLPSPTCAQSPPGGGQTL